MTLNSSLLISSNHCNTRFVPLVLPNIHSKCCRSCTSHWKHYIKLACILRHLHSSLSWCQARHIRKLMEVVIVSTRSKLDCTLPCYYSLSCHPRDQYPTWSTVYQWMENSDKIAIRHRRAQQRSTYLADFPAHFSFPSAAPFLYSWLGVVLSLSLSLSLSLAFTRGALIRFLRRRTMEKPDDLASFILSGVWSSAKPSCFADLWSTQEGVGVVEVCASRGRCSLEQPDLLLLDSRQFATWKIVE
jgi:hypothetical protein